MTELYPYNGTCLGGPYDGRMLRMNLPNVLIRAPDGRLGTYQNYLDLYWKWTYVPEDRRRLAPPSS